MGKGERYKGEEERTVIEELKEGEEEEREKGEKKKKKEKKSFNKVRCGGHLF